MAGSWKPGSLVDTPVKEMETFDARALPFSETYRLMIGTIIPRPIALVSTVDARGNPNLAPFSFFNGVASNPPTLMVSVARKPDGSKKDTLRNVEETGQFVVNGSHRWMLDPLVHCAGDFPYGESEFDLSGLRMIPSIAVNPPRVLESGVHFECEVLRTTEIGDGSPGSSTAIFGRIVLIHVMKDALDDRRRIKPEVLDPVARLGGISYSTLGTRFERAIPNTASPGTPNGS